MNRTLALSLVVAALLISGCSRGPDQAVAPAAPGAAAPETRPDAAPAIVAAPVAPAALVETIANIPDYPGARSLSAQVKNKVERGFTRSTEATFDSTAAMADVVAFYTKAITDKGWTVVSFSTKPSETKWRLSRVGAEAKIEIEKKVEQPLLIKIEMYDK
jgi:hypothetical protein